MVAYDWVRYKYTVPSVVYREYMLLPHHKHDVWPCDIVQFFEGGEWWLVPYSYSDNTPLADRIGPFSTKELARLTAECLYDTCTDPFGGEA